MPYETPPPMRPGSMPKWRDLNDAYSAIHELGESSSAFGSDLAIDRNSGQLQVNDYSTPGHWAKITGVSGGLYSHQQIAPDGTVLPAALPYYFGGTTSTTTPARELNGATVPVNAIVWLEIDTARSGWVFVYGAAAAPAPAGPIYARITGRSGGKYSFVQVTRNSSGTYIDVPGGITGNTSTTYAQDIGGLASDVLFNPDEQTFLLVPNPTVANTWLFGPVSLCS